MYSSHQGVKDTGIWSPVLGGTTGGLMSETSGTLVAFVERGKYRLSLLYNIIS